MKVFLSSTYIDLIEHRKAAHDALEQLGLYVIGMESFGARPEDSTVACMKEVEESDLFIGIYAHRYGNIPKDSDVSITEQEFDQAQELGKPIFGFVVDEEYPWSPKQIEHDKNEQLKNLLSKVKKQPIEFFTTPDNLAQKIASSIGRHLSELKAAEEEARLREISVNVGGNFTGTLTIGDHNTSNNSTYNFQPHKPTGNTLPTQSFFVGREKELKTIAEALSPDTRAWGALIDGPGGIGKTTLAIKAAHDASVELFDRKIFITAKVRELTPDGEKTLTDFTRPTYLAMLDELSKELGEIKLSHLALDERANALRLALAGNKVLIVFDNLETFPEEERVRLFQFLSRLPEGNKAIVTSRRRSDVDARIVRLDRLSYDEAMLLIQELSRKYKKLERASPKEYEDLYAITKGNPLFIRWIAGQLGREGSQLRTIDEAVKFIDKAPKGNDPLEYIFGDLLETFTENETKVLAALTHFAQPAKLNWLAQMTELPQRAAESALEDLTDRSILITNYEIRTYYLPPLTAQFIKTRRPEVVTKVGNTLVEHATTLALEYGGETNYEGFPFIDAEWDFFSALPRAQTGNDNRLQALHKHLHKFLSFTGRLDWFSEQAETNSATLDDKTNEKESAIASNVVGNFSNNMTTGFKNIHNATINIRRIDKGSALPNLTFFFGREEEIKLILNAISPESRSWGVLIFGEGGIGKTALALEAAHRIPVTFFENKIFVSAKERELTAKREFSSNEFNQNSYHAILNEIALQMGEEGIPLLAPNDRAYAVSRALNTKKVLLILDNLETLTSNDRDRLNQFLNRLPLGCKAIVTSRRRDETDGRVIRLVQLERIEGEKFITELVNRNPKIQTIDEIEKGELFYAANGNPLIIKWLIGQVGRDGTNIKTITEAIRFMRQVPKEGYGENKNDPVEYVFGEILNSLIPEQKLILAVMVFLNLSPKIEWIKNITGYDEKNIEIILEELANRSILSTIEDTKGYFLPSLSRQLVLRELSNEVADAEEKLAQYAYRIIIEYGGRKYFQNYEKFAENWNLIFAALPFCIKNDASKLQFIYDALDMFLISSGQLDELLWLNQQAETVALLNKDYDFAGKRAYKAGLIYGYRGQSVDVLQYANRAEKYWKEAYPTKESYNLVKPLVNYLQGVGYKIEKDYQKAIDVIEDAINIWKTLAPVSIEIADSLNVLGEIHIEMAKARDQERHLSHAENSINEALRIANKINYKEGMSKYKGNLAYLALTNNDWSKAIILAQEALEQAKEIGYQVEIARENFILASAYFELGHVGDKGKVAIRKSVETYTRLRHEDLPLAEKLMYKWERKMGSRI